MSFLNNITNFIFIDDTPQNADIIFVPGSGFSEAPERAASLWKEGYSKYILPSGRYSITNGKFNGPITGMNKYTKSYNTEWEFMKDILVQGGVDETYILKEDQATYTYENAINSRKITDSLGIKVNKAIISCQAFHARRSLMYYQVLYPDTQFFVCSTPTLGISRDNWYQTEDGINRILGEVERCGTQFHEIIREYSKKINK